MRARTAGWSRARARVLRQAGQRRSRHRVPPFPPPNSWHGWTRTPNLGDLASYDVVVTTLSMAQKNAQLFSCVHWHRVIVDEFHLNGGIPESEPRWDRTRALPLAGIRGQQGPAPYSTARPCCGAIAGRRRQARHPERALTRD